MEDEVKEADEQEEPQQQQEGDDADDDQEEEEEEEEELPPLSRPKSQFEIEMEEVQKEVNKHETRRMKMLAPLQAHDYTLLKTNDLTFPTLIRLGNALRPFAFLVFFPTHFRFF
jgi:hypothetical protein